MIPLGAIKYIIQSGILVISFFFAMRCLFAHEMRLEAWRSMLKHRVYLSRKSFRICTRLLGWLCLFVSLTVAYYLILDLLTD